MAKFRVILKNRNFFLLWLGQIISQIGDRLDQMALIAFVYMRTPGSSFEIAKILSFTIIPVFLIGPLAGAYVDRWDRRKTMYICDFLRACLVLLIPLFLFYLKSLLPVYIIIFVVFSIGRFFVPAKLSIIPGLVEGKNLLAANSLINVTGMIAAVLGFGLSGVLIEKVGAKSGFYFDSLSFLISGSLIFLISKKNGLSHHLNIKEFGKEFSKDIVAAIKKSIFQEVKEGVMYFLKNRQIRFSAGIVLVLWSALGSIYAVMITFVQNTLQSVTKDLGLLAMFLGAGLFFGSLIYGRFGHKLSQYKVIFYSMIFNGIMLIIFSLGITRYPYFYVAALLALLLGASVSPIMIASNTIIHSASSHEMMGKIFSSLEIVMHLGFLVFMFLSSLLAEKFSHSLILIVVGCIIILMGCISLLYKDKTVCVE